MPEHRGASHHDPRSEDFYSVARGQVDALLAQPYGRSEVHFNRLGSGLQGHVRAPSSPAAAGAVGSGDVVHRFDSARDARLGLRVIHRAAMVPSVMRPLGSSGSNERHGDERGNANRTHQQSL